MYFSLVLRIVNGDRSFSLLFFLFLPFKTLLSTTRSFYYRSLFFHGASSIVSETPTLPIVLLMLRFAYVRYYGTRRVFQIINEMIVDTFHFIGLVSG